MSRRRAAALFAYAFSAAALFGFAALHAFIHGYSIIGTPRFAWALVYLALLWFAAYVFEVPNIPANRSRAAAVLFAAASASLGFSAVQLLLGSQLLPRFVGFVTAIFTAALWLVLARWSARDRLGVDRVLFVGTGVDLERVRADLTLAPEHASMLVDALALREVWPRGRADEPLVDLAITDDIDVVVLDADAQRDRLVVAQASTLHEAGVRVRSTTDFYDEWLGKLPVFDLQRMSLMFDIQEVHGTSYARMKRVVDVGVGCVGSVVFLLAIPFVVLGDLVANRGRLLYPQRRVGQGGREFEMLKFRTMRDGETTDWTAENDPRVTPFGRLLRRTHLDELPQFVNILRGDLSLVGPRPEQPRYVAQLVECLPFYRMRHLVRPGLTGWAQVKYGYAGDEHGALEKLQYDFYYLGHQSLGLDVRIIARTARSLVGRPGR